MSLTPTPVQSAAHPMPAMGFDALGFCPNFPPKSAGIFGRVTVPTASRRLWFVGAGLMKKRGAFRPVEILHRKEVSPCDVAVIPSAPRDGLPAAKCGHFPIGPFLPVADGAFQIKARAVVSASPYNPPRGRVGPRCCPLPLC